MLVPVLIQTPYVDSYSPSVTFQVQKDGSKFHPLVIETQDTTIRALHTRLGQIGDISKRDASNHTLTLRVYTWAPFRGVKRGREVSYRLCCVPAPKCC
jgi:hypothetical protein